MCGLYPASWRLVLSLPSGVEVGGGGEEGGQQGEFLGFEG